MEFWKLTTRKESVEIIQVGQQWMGIMFSQKGHIYSGEGFQTYLRALSSEVVLWRVEGARLGKTSASPLMHSMGLHFG